MELDLTLPQLTPICADQRQYSIGLNFAVSRQEYRKMIEDERRKLFAEFIESRKTGVDERDETPGEFNQAFNDYCRQRDWSDPDDPEYFVIPMTQTELWTEFRATIEQGRWSEPDNLREAWGEFLAKHGQVVATDYF